MSNSTNSKDDNKKYINTRGRNYFCRGVSGEAKALSANYMNDCIKIGIHDELPANKQVPGKSKYNFETGTLIYLVPKTALALSKIIKKAIKATEAGQPFASATTSAVNLIEICNTGKHGSEAGVISLIVYNKLNENKIADTYDVFQFNSDIEISGYTTDGTNAMYDVIPTAIDLEYFYEQLRSFAIEMSSGAVHAFKVEMSWTIDRFAARQISIAEKLGIASDYTSKNGSKGSAPNWANGGGSSNAPVANDKISSSSELEDMIASIS